MSRRREPVVSTTRRSPALKLVPVPGARVASLARVAQARRRIAAGWYDRSEVRDRLVEAVLQEIRGR